MWVVVMSSGEGLVECVLGLLVGTYECIGRVNVDWVRSRIEVRV